MLTEKGAHVSIVARDENKLRDALQKLEVTNCFLNLSYFLIISVVCPSKSRPDTPILLILVAFFREFHSRLGRSLCCTWWKSSGRYLRLCWFFSTRFFHWADRAIAAERHVEHILGAGMDSLGERVAPKNTLVANCTFRQPQKRWFATANREKLSSYRQYLVSWVLLDTRLMHLENMHFEVSSTVLMF